MLSSFLAQSTAPQDTSDPTMWFGCLLRRRATFPTPAVTRQGGSGSGSDKPVIKQTSLVGLFLWCTSFPSSSFVPPCLPLSGFHLSYCARASLCALHPYSSVPLPGALLSSLLTWPSLIPLCRSRRRVPRLHFPKDWVHGHVTCGSTGTKDRTTQVKSVAMHCSKSCPTRQGHRPIPSRTSWGSPRACQTTPSPLGTGTSPGARGHGGGGPRCPGMRPRQQWPIHEKRQRDHCPVTRQGDSGNART